MTDFNGNLRRNNIFDQTYLPNIHSVVATLINIMYRNDYVIRHLFWGRLIVTFNSQMKKFPPKVYR